MNILFVVPYPIGEAPSQRFRFEHYFEYLKNNGTKLDIEPFISAKNWKILYTSNGKTLEKVTRTLLGFIRRFRLVIQLGKYDLIFIHREATPLGFPWFEFIAYKILKKKIIYDFDDAIWLEDPDEKGTLKAKLKYKKKVSLITQWSYKISVGNDYLADYARQFNSNVVVIPTVVNTDNYHNPELNEKVKNNISVIGWTGTHSTMGYLNKLIPLLKEIYEQHPFQLRIISNVSPKFDFPDLQFIKWNKETEIADLNQFDIGIMPLTKDEWSKGKCGFKIIQYMALEIPAIADNIGVNSQIIDHGKNGFLYSHMHECKEYLIELLKNENLRKSFGKNARNKVISKYSVTSSEKDFLKLLQ